MIDVEATRDRFIEIYQREIHREGATSSFSGCARRIFSQPRPVANITVPVRGAWPCTVSMCMKRCDTAISRKETARRALLSAGCCTMCVKPSSIKSQPAM